MFIDKYTAFVKDNLTKKQFKIVLEENTPKDAHKQIYNRLNNYQDIVKIEDYLKNTVFELEKGFINT